MNIEPTTKQKGETIVSFFKIIVYYNHPSIWTLIKKNENRNVSRSPDETKSAQFALDNIKSKKKEKTYKNTKEKLYKI